LTDSTFLSYPRRVVKLPLRLLARHAQRSEEERERAVYSPPPVVQTEVFAELPAHLRKNGQQSEWMRGQPGGGGIVHSLLEGPSFDRAGTLYCVDCAFGRVFRVSPGGRFSVVAEYDGEPNGLKIHKDGRIFLADYKNGIMCLDPEGGIVTSVCQRYRVERLKAVNDLVFASTGDLYFTDQGLTGLHDPTGRVFRLRAAGQLDLLLDCVPSPNGLVFDLSESTLLVAATRGNSVWRVPFMPDGTVAKVGIFIQMSGGHGPDGMALDEAGNLAVAHVGKGCVWLFSPDGEPLLRIESCRGKKVTNVAYGGPDRRTLFITEIDSGCILTARLEVPGRIMFSHM
jgi:gluconolactonase